jgi:PGAP1-like protein
LPKAAAGAHIAPMNQTLAPRTRRPTIRSADLRGAARLGFQAFDGIASLVEQMHATIAGVAPPLGPSTHRRARGLTGFVYGTVRGVARGIGGGIDAAFGLLPAGAAEAARSPAREAMLAVVNGLWGDRLAADGNPLAIPMALHRHDAAPPTGRVLVLLHGLCMNDLQWARDGQDHGRALAKSGGWTPLYLHYDSGRHVSDNGRELAALLETTLADWPVPVERLALLGHSMGGLVARSAIHQARAERRTWPRRLTALVCLGTPHHGAALERGGRWLERLLEASPYVAPFARLGRTRSAGITDLRFGNLQAADWQGRPVSDQRHDDRRPTPLPPGLPVFLVAATTASAPRGLRHALVGDGLVTLASAWGEHRDPARALSVPASHRMLLTSAHHWDLLHRAEVRAQLQHWLRD